MSRFAILALCVQVCLIQNVFSQCGCNQISYGPSGLSGLSINQPSISAPTPSSGYGGVGTGQVAVAGDIAASGSTCVVGSVPVLGSVDFSGTVPASGSVSISGQCGCGCSA